MAPQQAELSNSHNIFKASTQISLFTRCKEGYIQIETQFFADIS